MATDARISTGLPSHPKTKKLIRKLGQPAGWSLVCLFLWTAANRSDGDLSGMSVEDIEIAAEWDGSEGAFVSTLVAVRFLDGETGSHRLHDWAEHNPWAATAGKRSAKARWNAVKRHHGEAEANRMVPEYAGVRTANAGSTANSMLGGRHSNPPSPFPNPSPSPSPNPYPTKKRRTASPRSRLPEDFRPNESGLRAASDAGVDLPHELQQFRDWHQAQGTLMADWQAAWRTWIGKAVEFGRGRKPQKQAGSTSPSWCTGAGFPNVFEANNAGCFEHTAGEFRDGKRLEVA